MTEDIATGGKLPKDYRWQRFGDKAYAVRDLAHRPVFETSKAQNEPQ